MSKELIIHSTPSGVEVGLLENKQLVEFHKESAGSKFHVGDVFYARVKKIVPSLNAAFVDVGYHKDGFLHYTDLGPQLRSMKKLTNMANRGQLKTHLLGDFKKEPDIIKTGKIDKVLSRKDVILVQVVKEPISSKGPRLTSELSVPGRTMVLTPFNDFIGISKRIEDQNERKRLRRALSSIKPEGFGLIVRTNGVGKGVAELHSELTSLVEKWDAMMANVKGIQKYPSKVLSEAGMTTTLLRDYVNDDLTRIVVDDASIYSNIVSYIDSIKPDKSKIVQQHTSDKPIFSKYDVTKQIKSSFGRQVKMASGAYLVIEHTEALHVIDVNSGNKISTSINQDDMALQVNLEAANEIARQLRLRDIGGIIVVDFIDMRNPEYKRKLVSHMKAEMKKDLSKHLVLPLSRFGLMQITRQRTKPEMEISTTELCPTCRGTGKTASTLLLVDEIQSDLNSITLSKYSGKINIQVNPIVGGFLTKGFPSPRMSWSWENKKWIKVSEDEDLPITSYKFLDVEGKEIQV